jgi:hypothetical protein
MKSNSMELTAKEILEKHKLIVAKRYGHSDWVLFANNASEENLLNGISEAGIAATKEITELAYREGWQDRDSESNENEHISLKEDSLNIVINSLFPEGK